jgi:4-amino-4-deoxy-L-arabinose transferase-like glycosyltransferase
MNFSSTFFKAGSLLLLAALLFFTALNSYQLRGSTEPRVAGIAAGVLIDDDWVTPKLNGLPFLEKPPLSIWLDAVGIKLFGATPLAVRLASAIAGILTALTVFWQLLRLQKNNTAASLAGLLLITMAQFWANVRGVGEDALLTLGVTVCLLAFINAQTRRGYLDWLLFAIGLAIATLSKGVLGLALPGATIFAYLLSNTLIEKQLTLSAWLRPAAAAMAGLIPLTIWLWLLYQRNGGNAIAEVLWANSVGRFGGEFENNGHFEPIYYYLTKLPEVFLPWNILVFLGLWQLLKRAKRDPLALFFCCWLIAPFILLSLSSGKRMVYLLALYPAAAIIAADYCAQLLQIIKNKAPASTAARAFYAHRQILMTGALALITIAFLYRAAIWEPRQDHKQSLMPLMTEVNALLRDGRQVALYQPSERLAGATVFYTGRTLQQLNTAAELQRFLAAGADHVAVTQSDAATGAARIIHRTQVGRRGYVFLAR